MLEFLRKQLAELLEARGALADQLTACTAEARAANRHLTEAEETARQAARAALVAHDEEIAKTERSIKEAEEDEQREQRAAALAQQLGDTGPQSGEQRAAVKTGHEPTTYRKGGDASYFRDLVAVSLNRGDSRAALDRLTRNSREVEVETRAQSTTDGAGGEFVPPLWMVADFVKLARAGRVVADQLRRADLPGGTDSISLPRMATGTAVAAQANQNTAVQNTDATTDSVTAKVETIAGQQVLALQLIEQSPINVDEVYLADLAADYAVKADAFVINNNAANKRGLLNVTGVNAITYTDATPTVGELYPKIADSVQQIHTGRFMPAQKIFMHPRRWAWFTAQTDTAGRPLVLPAANIPQNVLAAMGDVVAEGFVGLLQGLPVYVDPNIPTNLGAGTNEDRIITVRTDDVILFEGTPRAEAFRETKADQLSVLLRFYNYVALQSERYPKSISVIAGTGLVTPTF